MKNIELEIYEWTIKNWKILSNKATSYNKYHHPQPISVQLERRFFIDPRTASKIANSVALWIHIIKGESEKDVYEEE